MVRSRKRDVALQSGLQQASADAQKQPVAKPASVRPTRKQIAFLGERAASLHLLAEGYVLLHTNWRSGRFGEIDLIVQARDGTIVFVEVKTRRRAQHHSHTDTGIDASDWSKRRKIIVCAQSYLARHTSGMASCRIDVLIVYFGSACLSSSGPELKDLSVLHIANAFDASG